MTSIFEGLRVVDMTSGMAGPMTSMVLADNGAEVVKVEPPRGDWARSRPGFHMWNRGKKSVALDPTVENDRRELDALIRTADVVITAFGDGRADQFMASYENFEADCPSLIWCEISGFGLGGKYESVGDYESLVMATCGRNMGNGLLFGANDQSRASTPLYLAAPIASFGAAILALQGVSAALYARTRTGLGQSVKTSLLQGVIATTMRMRYERSGQDLVLADDAPGLSLMRMGIALSFLVAECSDGRFIQMCARQDSHFRNWMTAIGMQDIFNEERYVGAPMGFLCEEDLLELEARIRQRMSEKSQAEWMDLFVNVHDVGADPFLMPEEFLDFPDMTLNGRVVTIEDPVFGPVKQVGPLAQFSGTPSVIDRPAPRLGEHQSELVGWTSRPSVNRPFCGPVADDAPRRATEAPLDGVTIVEVAYFLAGPFGTTFLAELGARVIKVEPPGGDPYRKAGLECAHLLTGKESIVLDLKSPKDYDVFCDITRRADAFLTSFRHGVPAKIGIDYDRLSQVNPDLVYVFAAAYGSRGPWGARAAFQSTPNALCGGGILQGGRGNPPVDDSYSDPCSGLTVGAAIMLGLLARQRYGQGQYIETTMLASAGYVHSNELTFYDGREAPAILDHEQFGTDAGNRIYQCSSGWICVSTARHDDWAKLAATLGHSEWVAPVEGDSEAATGGADDALTALCQTIFLQRTATEWEKELRDAGVPAAVLDDATLDVFLHREGLLEPTEHPAFGQYWRLPKKIQLSRGLSQVGVTCGIGENSEELLAEFAADRAPAS